jgi:hypothetical protein
MDKKKKNLQEMYKLGFTNKTLSLLSESQIEMILEKIKKKESKEATITYRPDEKIQAKNVDPTKMKKNADGSVSMETTEATITYRPDEKIPAKNIDPTKMKKNADGSVSTEVVEGKKKKKKYNPWAVCTASVGRKNKKKFEDCVMGVKKKLKEGRNPYEYLIESKMEEIVENNLSPKMTKGEIMSIIAEKKMMMKKPIGTMIGGEMGEGDTKTAPAQPRTTPKTEPGKRPSNPGKKEGPNPKPKASEMESKKSEIITAISNLIDKALK